MVATADNQTCTQRLNATRKAGPMPPDTETKRETWLDWQPDDAPEPDLYTRAEIATMASGVDPVTVDDIRYWEYQGVLPRSIRRRHQDATRAVYPEWYAPLARLVRMLQRHDLTLEEIRPRIREHLETQKHLADTFAVELSLSGVTKTTPGLVTRINRLAQDLARGSDATLDHIELVITFTDGNGHVLPIPVLTPDADQ